MAFISNKNARVLARKHREYKRAIRVLSMTSNPSSAEKISTTAKDSLIAVLEWPEISDQINRALEALPKSTLDKQYKKFDLESSEFKQELQIAADMGYSKAQFFESFKFTSDYSVSKLRKFSIENVSDLVKAIENNHVMVVAGLAKSRNQSKKDKKVTKKHYLKISSKIVLGTGCLGLNTFTLTLPMSYFVSLTFFYGAAENVLDGPKI